MVKHCKLFLISIFFLSIVFFPTGCNLDFAGLFTSSDISERLKSMYDFKFLTQEDLSLSLTSISPGVEYKFIVLTDTHIEDGKTFGFENFQSAITAHGAEFVLVLGDLTQYGAKGDIQKYVDITGSFSVPCFPVIGNHDIYFDNWIYYRDLIGSTVYKVSGNGTNLFILDSANSFFGKEQLDWLEKEIKKVNQGERIFVFTHSPLFVSGPANMQQITDLDERARIISILRNRCDIMFMGHSHKYYDNETGNVRYVAIEDFVSKKAYCVVTVPASGKVTFEFKTF